MSAEYSVEEVRHTAEFTVGIRGDMLTAYANLLERIKADEAVDGRIDFKGMWNDMSDRTTTHPIAQPAQSVDVLTIREVILALQGHVSPAWTRLKCADKLTAALPEKGNG